MMAACAIPINWRNRIAAGHDGVSRWLNRTLRPLGDSDPNRNRSRASRLPVRFRPQLWRECALHDGPNSHRRRRSGAAPAAPGHGAPVRLYAVLAEDGDGALAICSRRRRTRIDAVILDLVMPDLDGMGVLAKMREAGHRRAGHRPDGPWRHRHGRLGHAGRRGGFRGQAGRRRAAAGLARATRWRRTRSRTKSRRIKRAAPARSRFKDIITRSPRMQTVLRTAEKAAASHIPVLIEGESGVGKELFARAIHGSRRAPRQAIRRRQLRRACPTTSSKSILFGHEKGAFTGATERHIGKFVEASGGTLFLDEVGELPPAAQVKLLRAIQEGEVEPVGARKPVKVDVRIISATNRNLIDEVSPGPLPRGSVLPPPRLSDHRAAVARTPRGHSGPGAAFPRPLRRRRRPHHPRYRCRGAGAASARRAGRATCGNWRTRCFAPSSWPTATSSGSMPFRNCRRQRCKVRWRRKATPT